MNNTESIESTKTHNQTNLHGKLITASTDEHVKNIFHQIRTSKTRTVINFGASWCGMCANILPSFKQLSNKFPKLSFVYADIDECPETTQHIRYTPTFHQFRYLQSYLVETVKDTYRTVSVSVSPEGAKFLRSCRPDHQPPLLFPISGELCENEDIKSTLTASGTDGLSQAEAELYKLLLEERMKLARSAGTAPYAICGDLTLKKIAATRPSGIY